MIFSFMTIPMLYFATHGTERHEVVSSDLVATIVNKVISQFRKKSMVKRVLSP